MLVLFFLAAIAVPAQDVPQGWVVKSVRCLTDPSQTYALYVPSNYARERSCPGILAFDPRARGRVPVEIYQAENEQRQTDEILGMER